MKKLLISGCVFIIFQCTACKKLIEIDSPAGLITETDVYASDSSAKAAVIGVYSRIMQTRKTLLNGGPGIYLSFSADELKPLNEQDEVTDFYENKLAPENVTVSNNFWLAGYNIIYQVNKNIEGLSASSTISPVVKSQLLGESKFIRALCYLYLVNVFGDVPLTTSSNIDKNKVLPRSSRQLVYQQILQDLLDAWLTLTSNGAIPDSPGPAAAAGLLARVYSYTQNWAQAEMFSTTVINSGRYNLETDLNNVFLKDSRETIFQLAPPSPGNNTSEGYTFLPPSSNVAPRYAITSSLLSSFENGDQRIAAWMNYFLENGGQRLYFPYKYKVYATQQQPKEYNILLRLSEQYLIRAEARAHQGNLQGAIEDVNIIRTRAGLPALATPDSISKCLAAVMKERRTELFAEWGHRWFDLKRTNQIDSVLHTEKGKSWQTTDQLFPIPLNDIQKNPSLTQNDGY